ncbi:MAG: phage portal protein [Sphingomonadales bacterium]|nr:phage portal protein [Sphingomonadales bacterium]
MLGLLRKSTAVTLEGLAGLVGWMGWRSATGMDVSERSAIDVSAVFCAARVIAEGIAQMPVRVVRDEIDRKTGLVRVRVAADHWAHRLLAVRPNDWMTSFEFREAMVFNAALGRGAIAIKNVINGEVRELLPVPPWAWSVEQLPDWSLRIRVDHADKTHEYFDLRQVFYLRGPSLDGVEGLSAIRAARDAIGLSKALEHQQAKLAANGGKPSGILSFKDRLGPETREKLRKDWRSTYGQGGDGGIAVLDGEASFSSITMTSVDAQHLETRRLQVEEIARAFRVLPIMLMQSDKAATYSSAEQMFRMHVIHTLGPWIERFEQAAARDILGQDQKATDLRVDLDERNLLRGDFAAQGDYYAKALGAGGTPAWMTQDEIRAEVGLDPLGGDAGRLSQGAMKPEGSA